MNMPNSCTATPTPERRQIHMREAIRALRRSARRTLADLESRFLLDWIFIHINKTGGSSIEKALGLPFDHRSAREKIAAIGSDVWERKFSFSFVRNPWERLVSWYQYVQRTPLHEDCRPGETFADFAARFLEKPRRAQWWMIEDLNGVMGLDYVGRFENLNDDIAYLCQRIGIKAQTLPHRNKMADKDYRTFYDDRLALAVKNNWTREIDAFGYTFEP